MSTSPYPIHFGTDDDLRRSRLTVFFRIFLLIPHWIVLYVYYLVTIVVVFIAWFAALITGRVPTGLHNFTAGFVRYQTRVNAYQYILANPYPPFGSGGTYPVDVEIDPPAPQGRVGVFFRIILLLPCWFMIWMLNYALIAVAFGGWWVALFTGRVPAGLAALGHYCVRFNARVTAYQLLLTSRYPVLGDPLVSESIAPRSQGSLPPDQTTLPPLP